MHDFFAFFHLCNHVDYSNCSVSNLSYSLFLVENDIDLK